MLAQLTWNIRPLISSELWAAASFAFEKRMEQTGTAARAGAMMRRMPTPRASEGICKGGQLKSASWLAV